MNTFITDIKPLLEVFFEAILTLAIGVATVYAKQKWGIDIEKKYQDDLHSGLSSGVKAAMEKFGPNAPKATILEHAIVTATNANKDAIACLKPSEDVLAKIALAKYADAKALVPVEVAKGGTP
jgi:hypothetical protein